MKINSILAILAVTGGITAAFTNHSQRNNLYPDWKFETERRDGRKIRYVSASHLADILYRKETGITIVDSRSREEYLKYHIPAAVLIDDVKGSSEDDRRGMLIIYDQDGDYELPATVTGLDGRILYLKGGLKEWYGMVLFPEFSEIKVRNTRRLEEILDRTIYFGGTPRNSQLLNVTQRRSRFREGC